MFACEVRQSSGLAEFWISGELDFSQVDQVRECWCGIYAQAPRAVILDVTRVEFVDVSGIRMLIRLARTAQLVGTGFAVVTGENPRLHRPLERLCFEGLLPTHRTRAEALDALWKAGMLPSDLTLG